MRIYYTDSLIAILGGNSDWLAVDGKVDRPIDEDVEEGVKAFERGLLSDFEMFSSKTEPAKAGPEPVFLMPDEFQLKFDLERMGRLAREALIHLIPIGSGWLPNSSAEVKELWIGGKDGLIPAKDRIVLRDHINEVRTRYKIKGKTFCLGEDITGLDRRSLQSAIMEWGGIVLKDDEVQSDYLVTDEIVSIDHKDSFTAMPAATSPTREHEFTIINTLMLRLMTSR